MNFDTISFLVTFIITVSLLVLYYFIEKNRDKKKAELIKLEGTLEEKIRLLLSENYDELSEIVCRDIKVGFNPNTDNYMIYDIETIEGNIEDYFSDIVHDFQIDIENDARSI